MSRTLAALGPVRRHQAVAHHRPVGRGRHRRLHPGRRVRRPHPGGLGRPGRARAARRRPAACAPARDGQHLGAGRRPRRRTAGRATRWPTCPGDSTPSTTCCRRPAADVRGRRHGAARRAVRRPGHRPGRLRGHRARSRRSSQPYRDAGLQVELGGELPGHRRRHHAGPRRARSASAVALLVLLLVFRSVVAAGVPIVLAVAGLAVGGAGVTVLCGLISVSAVRADDRHHGRARRRHRLRAAAAHPDARGPPRRSVRRGFDGPRAAPPPAARSCSPAAPCWSPCSA